MRIYENNFAYEVEQVIDRATQLPIGWRYNVYRVRPQDQILRSGDAATKERAEKRGRKALAEVIKADREGKSTGSRRAV